MDVALKQQYEELRAGYTIISSLQDGHNSRFHRNRKTLLYIVLYELINKKKLKKIFKQFCWTIALVGPVLPESVNIGLEPYLYSINIAYMTNKNMLPI
jgi:hypothetical protein